MNLVIDIGNSTVKVAFMDECNRIWDEKRDVVIPYLWIKERIKKYGVRNTIWISTRKIDDETEENLASLTPFTLHFLSDMSGLPVENCYNPKVSLGADRLALAIGVKNRLPDKECLIFGFGTAMTIDFLTADGKFMGGYISPGLQLRLSSLYEHTGSLPEFQSADFQGFLDTVPVNTEDAIFQGVFGSMLYEIEGHILRHPQSNLVFCGADAKYFVKKFKIMIFAKSGSIILEGLNSVLVASMRTRII